MVNMHLVDDGQGGIIAFRGPYNGTARTVLREGKNILRARLLLKINEHVSDIVVKGQNTNSDDAGANTDISARTSVDPQLNWPPTLVAEEMGDQDKMQHRANTEADWVKLRQTDGEITVQG